MKKTFPNKSEYHFHRKQNHRFCITPCSKENCKYGDKSCWFKHDEQNQSDNDDAETTADQKEVTRRIFEIMEKITERLVELEKASTTKK